MNDKTPVLIVGAGPCGLAAACTLLKAGIQVRVLDAAPEPNQGARAILLWPPTLELLREIGVLEEAEQLGFRTGAMNYHLGGGRVVRVDFDPENQPLTLQQDRTDQLLETALERLGGKVERSMRVTDVSAFGDTVIVKATGAEGTELIEADWLIGADGVGSTVRAQLGIEFQGERIPSTFLLAQGRMEGELGRTELHYLFGRQGVMVLAPLPGGDVRISAPIPDDTELTQETVQRLLDERGAPGALRMETDEVSTFRSQERIAAAIRQGRCFLVGDAAHTHSPAGGQGLNLGLQDVHNLVWKLSGVIQGRFDPAILDTYDTERRHVAEETVQLTHRMTRLAVMGPVAARIRNTVWSLLQTTGLLRRKFAPAVAGWRTSYPSGTLFAGPAGEARKSSGSLPAPGTRTARWLDAPWWQASAGFRLLTMGDTGSELARLGQATAQRHSALVTHHHLGESKAGFVLLRPDGYVAASGAAGADLVHAVRQLEHLLLDTAAAPAGA